MRRMLNRYMGRRTDPASRPDGALPVERAIFAAPQPAPAEAGLATDGPARQSIFNA
jgi:hypothetical protein